VFGGRGAGQVPTFHATPAISLRLERAFLRRRATPAERFVSSVVIGRRDGRFSFPCVRDDARYSM
jgi:hypothetical protein